MASVVSWYACSISFHIYSVMYCVSITLRSVRVSCKFWHMLINLCFHISLTCGVFVGGINQTRYASVCQAVSIHHPVHFRSSCHCLLHPLKLNCQQSKVNKCLGCVHREGKSWRWVAFGRVHPAHKSGRSSKTLSDRCGILFHWLEVILQLSSWLCCTDTHYLLIFHISLHEVPGWERLPDNFLFI